MIDEWLDTAAVIKCEEMVDSCERETEDLYRNLMSCLQRLDDSPTSKVISEEIENIFIVKTRRDVNFVFNNAYKMGLEIGKRLK